MRSQVLSLLLLSSSVVLAQHQPRSHRRRDGLLDAITARQVVSTSVSASVAATSTSVSSASDVTSSSTSSSSVVSSSSSSSSSATSSSVASSTLASSTVVSSSSAPVSSSSSAPVTSTSTTSSLAPVTTTTEATSTTTTAEATSTTAEQSTNSAGGIVTIIKTASASSSNAASASASAAPSGSSGLSTGAIIGISVVAGVAALAAGLFLVFRLTSKRFSGFDDDGDDAIRWPELNKHGESDEMGGVALPARPTGGAGLRTNALDGEDSDDGHDDPSANSSSAHLGMDPAVSSAAHSQEDYTSYPPQTNASYYDQQGGYPAADSYDSYGHQNQQQQQGVYGGGYPSGGYGGYDDDEGGAQGHAGVGALGRSRSMGVGDTLDGGGMPMGEVSRAPAATGGWASAGGEDPYSVAGVSRRT